MDGIPTECAKNVTNKLLDLTISQARYLCCYTCIVKNFETEKKELEPKVRRVEKDVEEANNRNESTLEDVEFWLTEGGKLITEDTEKKKKWVFGWLPNCIWQYRRGKDLAEKTVRIKKLKASNFDRVGRHRELLGVMPQDFIQFESRDSAYQKLLKAFEDGTNYMVALLGMAGSGKTTLAKIVGEKVKESKLFDKVVFTVISNNPNPKKIQKNIASLLGLDLKEEDEQETRAHELLLRLTNGQKILLILDDLWKELNFEGIGIPSKGYHNGCRVLLSSRESRTLINCQVKVQLLDLSKGDSRILFNKNAGLKEHSTKDIKELAAQIADQCKELPIAIVTIARSLQQQPLEVWKAALERLTKLKGTHNVDEKLIIYENLQLSYTNLEDGKAKKLFLLCSLFPEDYEIPQELLTRFVVGLGLFDEVDSYEAARNDVLFAKRKLLDACLLLEGEEEGCVKMHDLLRDVAHWIAQHDIQVIMGPKMNAAAKQSRMKYLYCNHGGFLKELDCSKLEILILLGKEVPAEEFFEGVKDLRILTLDNKEWWIGRPSLALPISSESSKSLRNLCLTGFILGDISILRHLQAVLETLELISCSFNELPNGIVEFKKLKLLSLIGCEIGRNPYEVIGGLSQIEEVYFMENHGWEEMLDSEVVANLFDEDSISQTQLKRYHAQFGRGMDLSQSVSGSISRAISIENFDASISNATMKDLVQKAEILHLREMQGDYRTIIPDFVATIGGALNELIELKLRSSSKIHWLINTTNPSSSGLSNLSKLELTCMDSLKEICHTSPPSNFFEKLEEIVVMECKRLHGMLFIGNLDLRRLKVIICKDCPMLTSLFTASTARSLKQLEELTVMRCKEVKHIIVYEGEEEKQEEIVPADNDQKSYGSMFPKLNSVKIQGCGQELEFVSTDSSKSRADELINSTQRTGDPTTSLMLLDSKRLHPFDTAQCFLRQPLILSNMRRMELKNCPKLMSLFTLSVTRTMLLEELRVENCNGLKSIIAGVGDDHGSKNRDPIFPKLKELYIKHCSQLEYFLGQYNREDQNRNIEIQMDLPALEKVSLLNLDNMVSFCPKHYHATCVSLKFLKLESCHHYKSLFTVSTAQSLQLLEEITVVNCQELTCIVASKGGEEEQGQIAPNDDDQQVYGSMFPNLKTVTIRGCNKFISTVGSKSSRDMGIDLKATKLDPTISMELQKSDSRWLHPFLTAQCLLRQSLILRNVRSMSISNSPNLMSLFTLSFAQQMLLENLKVQRCDGLKSIIADMGDDHAGKNCSSVFPKLRELYLANCSQLEYLLGQYYPEDQNHITEIQIDLPSLEEVTLYDLRSMISICPKNYYASCVSLKVFNLERCPRFTVKSITDFHRKDQNLAKLERVNVNDCRIEGIFWREGVVMVEQVMSSGLKFLRLENLPEMRYICKGHKHMHFQNLGRLLINGCNKLEAMFPASVFKSMSQLTFLYIENCKQLKQIIEEQNDVSNSLPQEIQATDEACFPRLKAVVIRDCPNLEAPFSISTSYEFPELEVLIVNRAFSQLQKLFARKGHVIVEFPKLKYLFLIQLPNLAHVCQGIDLHTVTYRFVHNCPKLSVDSTTRDLDQLRLKYRETEESGDNYSLVLDVLFNIAKEITAENPKEETTAPYEDEIFGIWEPSRIEASTSQVDREAETQAFREVPRLEKAKEVADQDQDAVGVENCPSHTQVDGRDTAGVKVDGAGETSLKEEDEDEEISRAGLIAHNLSNSHFAEASEARARIHELEIEVAKLKAELETRRSSQRG